MTWLWTPVRRPEAAVQLFCLPYAGGGASAYRGWPAALGPQVEVHAVRLPGREDRIGEPSGVDPAAVAVALAATADRPYVLFGHSMGARLAFEVVRRLRARGACLPHRLYVAACRPPDHADTGPLAGLSRLDDEELVARLEEHGNLPASVAASPDLVALFLPALRADFRWLDEYRYVEAPPLTMPIVGFAATGDALISPEEMHGWQSHTTAGFTLHTIGGDHFFPYQRLDELVSLIRPALDPGRPGADHRIEFGRWSVWRDALLRATGFPVDGLDLLATPECAIAADAYLAGTGEVETFDKQFAEALATGSERVREIAADPSFREAVTWQNSGAVVTLDALVRGRSGKSPSVVRRREMTTARYWQRYCAKNETIGFFGPVCWARVDETSPAAVVARPGPGLLRDRKVFFESWALAAYGQAVATDPQVRVWLRPVLQPHVWIAGGSAHLPPRPPVPLSGPELAALTASDGSRTAFEIVTGLGLPNPDDGYLLLERLVQRGLLRWDPDTPLDPSAERVLTERLAAIGDPRLRTRAEDGLGRLRAARDRVSAAAGDPVGLATALAGLDEEFTALTGQPPSRLAGQAYAARRLCYEDTARDLDVVFGAPLLRELAAPLDLMLTAARWLCAELAGAYAGALSELYQELAGASAGPGAGESRAGESRAGAAQTEVNLAELWFLAQGMLFGDGERPADTVAEAFRARWATVFGLADVPEATRALQFSAEQLAAPVARAFPDRGSGWSAGRLHSPDLQICAASVDAVNRGEFTAVLGEMHAAWATVDNAVFTPFHPRVGDLVEALAADLGPNRVRLLRPPEWPRSGGRLVPALTGPSDVQLGIAAAPGADRSRLVPASALAVVTDPGSGELTARAPDGRRWPLLEVFSGLLAIHAVDSFRLLADRPHTPRIGVDKLVVGRETWRTTVEATGLSRVTGDRARFLAARRWRGELGLPERVFVKVGTETKPSYVDFRSPLYVLSLCAFIRAAHAEGGGGVGVVVTEMLPTPEQAWVPDAAGNRYLSELRIQVGERHG